eukprot:484287-Pyramimonas_sp.AAC.1
MEWWTEDCAVKLQCGSSDMTIKVQIPMLRNSKAIASGKPLFRPPIAIAPTPPEKRTPEKSASADGDEPPTKARRTSGGKGGGKGAAKAKPK